ncbi:MAG: sulfatase-like hydrolase/transferase, partial [Planctomycetes bacterium]|nr:sulfatase-like hydrolase/transferase [Planctomycetota bacterium]
AAAQRMQRDPHGLERLDGADVHLLVLESYGRVALRHPALAPRLRGFLTRCQQQLAADGLAACSSSCAPAVKGGRSGLAHAELLTGVRVPSERVRSLLMASELVALPRRFQQAGYRTHELLPGMPIHWPEGDAFYGIDASIIQGELGYDGTLYDFGQMPDQFALQKLMERVIEPAEQPVFSMFVGVSSHAPWSAIPHYVDDWQIDARTFAGAPARTHDVHYRTMLRDPAALPAYADALEYVLRTAFDFARRLQRPSVVVVVGDHQPPIAGALAPADPSFDVPIHVVTNRPELLAPLRALGFVDGLDVPDEVRAWPMAEFAPTVLRAWSR